MPDIKLYSYPTSPYAQKVGNYLKYKNIDFTLIGVNPINNAQIAFTKQRQVPVLEIGTEWRKESSELGIWLDELYPEKPILPTDTTQREAILEIDKWLSTTLFPSYFRAAIEWQNSWDSIRNGWTLARAVHDASPIPLYARWIWPFAVKRAGFIVRMVNALDLNESQADMNKRLQEAFKERLGEGPFLAGQQTPTLADLSAFPIVANGKFMGMRRRQGLIDDEVIHTWAKRVYSHLPKNPLLVPDKFIKTFTL